MQTLTIVAKIPGLSTACASGVTPPTQFHRDRFTDVILPGQSYLSSVPESVAFCTNDANLAFFSLLSASFGRTAYSPTFDHWESVDDFGRSKIYKSFLATYRSI